MQAGGGLGGESEDSVRVSWHLSCSFAGPFAFSGLVQRLGNPGLWARGLR